jgi:PPP family 3-phenylpropionic acid transporter
MNRPAAARLSPELRTTFYYFVTFMSSGAAVAYGGIWFAEQGLSPADIGIVNGLPVLIMLGLNVLVGRLADRASDWRQVIVIGAAATGVLAFALFFAAGFWGILLVWTCIALPVSAIGPVADAASLRMTKRNGTDFGTIRAWGTVGYMAFNALTGFIVGWFGPIIFVPLFVALNVLRGLVSLWLPRFRAPAEVRTIAAVQPAAGRMREALKPWFVLPLVGASIVFGTHIILNAFAALLWQAQGIPAGIIGPLIALSAGAEAATMFAYRRFGGRFSARSLMLVSAITATVRWTGMAFSPPVYVLVFLQLLQSLSFAAGYLGTVHFIAKWTSEDIAAEVQSFFVVLQQAASAIALIGFGWLIGVMGAWGYLVAALFALAGAVCIWLSMRLKQPVPEST